ncbi:MAG TPA: hypothetical protein VIJ69_11070 [Actinomycetota bacterium]
MEPLDELDPLATVFPEEDVPPQGISPLGGFVETRAPRHESQLPASKVPFPLDPILAPVFRDFEQSGVRWCLLGFPEKEPEVADEEVVALVDRSALTTARRVLKANGFAPIPTWGRGPLARFVGYNPRSDRWVILDIATRLTYGPYAELETGAEGGCLERRRWEGGVYVLAADDAFWTLLLHVLLDDPTLLGARPPAFAKTLERLAVEARTEGPLGRVVASFLPERWSTDVLVDCVWDGDWDALERLAPVLAADWARRQEGAARRRNLANRTLRRFSARRLLPAPRGLSVALLAPEPAAKAALAEELGRTFYLPVTFMRMSAAPRSRGGKLTRAGLIVTLVTFWLRYLTGRQRRAKGRLVIFDRYTYDYRLPPARPARALGKLRRVLLGRACPAPDVVVVLDDPTPPKVRKLRPDVPYESVRQRYLDLAQRLPDAIVVEAPASHESSDGASMDTEHLRREITAQLWRAYAAAPPTSWLLRLGGLLQR